MKTGRKLLEVTKPNQYGYVGFMFSDSERWSSAKVKQDKKGFFFVSKGEKYYLKGENDNEDIQ